MTNLTLTSQVRAVEQELTRTEQRADTLARMLALERTALADLQNPNAQRVGVNDGAVVVSNDRLYIALHDLPMPPHGRVYQAWTLARGARAMTPSVTFIPDSRGVAVVALQDIDASHTSQVAVSIEPISGSKSPTSGLLFEVALQ